MNRDDRLRLIRARQQATQHNQPTPSNEAAERRVVAAAAARAAAYANELARNSAIRTCRILGLTDEATSGVLKRLGYRPLAVKAPTGGSGGNAGSGAGQLP